MRQAANNSREADAEVAALRDALGESRREVEVVTEKRREYCAEVEVRRVLFLLSAVEFAGGRVLVGLFTLGPT